MLVLKTTSPPVSPGAPAASPSYQMPFSSASVAFIECVRANRSRGCLSCGHASWSSTRCGGPAAPAGRRGCRRGTSGTLSGVSPTGGRREARARRAAASPRRSCRCRRRRRWPRRRAARGRRAATARGRRGRARSLERAARRRASGSAARHRDSRWRAAYTRLHDADDVASERQAARASAACVRASAVDRDAGAGGVERTTIVPTPVGTWRRGPARGDAGGVARCPPAGGSARLAGVRQLTAGAARLEAVVGALVTGALGCRRWRRGASRGRRRRHDLFAEVAALGRRRGGPAPECVSADEPHEQTEHQREDGGTVGSSCAPRRQAPDIRRTTVAGQGAPRRPAWRHAASVRRAGILRSAAARRPPAPGHRLRQRAKSTAGFFVVATRRARSAACGRGAGSVEQEVVCRERSASASASLSASVVEVGHVLEPFTAGRLVHSRNVN